MINSVSRYARVDGRRIHYLDAGAGASTVILESGLGLGGLQWAEIQPRVGRLARVIAYDRAGLGLSDPDRGRRTAKRLAGDLTTLLREECIPGPYVLVGHSWGGIVARTAARDLGDDVQGIVLVDATYEDMAVAAGEAKMRLYGVMFRWLSRVLQGFVRAWRALGCNPETIGCLPGLNNYPASVRRAVVLQHRGDAGRAARQEFAALPASLAEMRTAPPLRVPIVAVVGGKTGRFARGGRSIVGIYRRMAERFPNVGVVVAPGAGHLVPRDDPDLVVEMIARITQTRARA